MSLVLAFTISVRAETPPCRQALALGLDVSGSVDAREYRLQLDGLDQALGSDRVRAAIFSQPGAPIDILVYEWSGPDDQALIVEWTTLASPVDLDIVQATLQQARRREASSGTALGHALQFGLSKLEERGTCPKRTLDISGDGTSNLGPDPASIKPEFRQAGVTVNALVIGADSPGIGDLRQAEISELSSYFRTRVIVGENAFVQTALGFEAYGAAMAAKLEKEIEHTVFSGRTGKTRRYAGSRRAVRNSLEMAGKTHAAPARLASSTQ